MPRSRPGRPRSRDTRAPDHTRTLASREAAMRELEQARHVHQPGHEQQAQAADARRAVRAVAARLPADQRQAIFDAYWLERSRSEAAAALGIPLGTLKGRIRAGLSRMRPALDQRGVATG